MTFPTHRIFGALGAVGVLGAAAGALTACSADATVVVHGSGPVIQQQRDLRPVDHIDVEGSVGLTVQVLPPEAGALAESSGREVVVFLEGANDLLRLVETKIVDDTLVIRFKDGVRLDPLPSIEVHTTHLVALESRGDGDLRLQGVVPSCTRGQVLELTLKGSGDVRGDGSLERLSIQHLGSGDVDLRALNAETIDYAGYGSGDARLCASEALESNTYGCGDLFIYGTVPDERMKVSPVGSSMKRMD